MKYCRKCGAQMADNDYFCTSCGTRWNETTSQNRAKSRKKRRKKRLGIALAALIGVILIAAIVILAVTGVLSNPFESTSVKFDRLQKNYVMTALKLGESGLETRSKVNTDADITFQSETGTSVDNYLNQIGAELRISDDSVVNFGISFGGTTLLTGSFDSSDDGIGISCPELFDGYYVINPDDLDDICSALGISTEIASVSESGTKLTSSEINDIVSGYLDIVLSLSTDENTVKSSGTTVLPGLGESVKCNTITCTPSQDDYETMLTTLFEELLSDDNLEELCEMFNAEMAVSGYSDDLYAELRAEIETDLENVKDIAASAAELGLKWEVSYKGSRIYSIRLTDENGQGIGYESFGATTGSRSDALVTYSGEAVCEDTLLSNSYTIKGTQLTGIAALQGESYSVSYDVSLKKCSGLLIPYGIFTLKLGEETATVSFTTEESGKGSISTLKMAQEDGTFLSVLISTTDKASTAERPSGEAIALNADNVSSLLKEVEGNIIALVYTLY